MSDTFDGKPYDEVDDMIAADAAIMEEEAKRQQTQAVVLAQPQPEAGPVNPQDARNKAVADLTHAAYAKASQLQLTPEEIAGLQQAFPDEAFKPGAAGKENLIYIEHASLRERLNQVLGLGQWAIIPRSRWEERYEYFNTKANRTEQAARIYVEAMLLIRGCFVAEAVGDMVYYPKNQSTNYGDAVEGAKSSALRRCAKELGVGLQAWSKDWCEGWWQRRKNAPTKGREYVVRPASAPQPKAPPASNGAAPAQPQRKSWSAMSPEEKRESLIRELRPYGEAGVLVLRDSNHLLDTESLDDLNLFHVEQMSREQALTLVDLAKQAHGLANTVSKATKVFAPKLAETLQEPPVTEPDNLDDGPWWKEVPVPSGVNKGVLLGDLETATLWGWWMNFKVETSFVKDGKTIRKKPETVERERKFREALDAAGLHYEFKKGKTK